MIGGLARFLAAAGLLILAGCAVAPSPLAELSQTLASLPDVKGQDGVGSDPSRGARPALTTAKHQLRDFLDTALSGADARTSDIDADAFAARLNDQLRTAGVPPMQMWRQGGALIAVTSFPIICGSDDSIYGWNWNGQAWQRVIEHEATDYTPGRYQPEAIDGADSLRFAVAGPDSDAGLHILVTGLNTGCTSGWQDRRFQLYDLDRHSGSAALLVDGEVPAFTNEGDRNASLTADRMVIEYTGADFDPRKMPFGTRASVYALADDKATPVAWAAADAEDFTEQWIAAPWSGSATVSATTNRSLEGWHHRLHAATMDSKTLGWTSIGDAVRCHGDGRTSQYAITFGRLRPDTAPADADFIDPSTAYFTVRETAPNTFVMANIAGTPNQDCPAVGR